MSTVKKSLKNEIGCISNALDTLGDKWTALIIKELVDGPRCFSELELALNNISPRTLSARLDKLLSNKVIDKEIYCSHPPRHRYMLTNKGAELEKILQTMAQWGAKYNGNQ